MSANILVLGSVNIDLVVRAARLPTPGETVVGGEFFQSFGGKGANQAVAASRLAPQTVSLVAAVGDDEFGKAARRQLLSDGIDLSHMRVLSDARTGVALIMVDQCGENCISVASGANARMTERDVQALPDRVFHEASIGLCCLESPVDAVLAFLRRARAAGVRTVLNPAPVTDEVSRVGSELLPLADVVTPNQGEAESLAGMPDGSPLETARRIQRMSQGDVIVTLGSRGCLVQRESQTCEIAGHRVAAVDTTAAGDAFNGALAVGLRRGDSVEASARIANRVAAVTVTRRGAQISLPDWREVESVLGRA